MDRKITNTEESNYYHNIVNDLIHSYIKEWNIKPTKLKEFFSKNELSFLKQNKLDDVIGINKVVSNVLEDIVAMELDGLLKFDDFSLNESLLSIGKSNNTHEDILGDFYNTSLGHINPINDDIHLYEIDDFGQKIKSIIFSKEEINKIKNVLRDKYLEEVKKNTLSVGNLGNLKTLKFNIKVEKIIDIDKYNKLFDDEINEHNILRIINTILDNKNTFEEEGISFNKIEYKKLYKNFHIWEIV